MCAALLDSVLDLALALVFLVSDSAAALGFGLVLV
jgi:hypothetical protein